MGLIPLCAMEQLGFKTTSPDPYYYISEHLDICVLSERRAEDVKLVEKDKKYYVISGKDFTSNFVLEVNKIPRNNAESPRLLTQQTTIHFIWLDSARVSIWTPEKILSERRMVPPKSFNLWNFQRKTMTLVKVININL